MRTLATAAAVAALSFALAAPVGAHSPIAAEKADDLAQLVARSNLVAVGEVATVQYKNARDPQSGRMVPHSIVTFRVAKAMRGRVPGDVLVLRFLGGPDGMGGFFQADGVPLFQPGDRDVLFVAGNGEAGCPLAMCEYGRYRLLGDRVFDTHGAPVRAIVKDGAISRGLPPRELMTYRYPAPKFDDLVKNPEVQAELKKQGLSMEVARRRYETEAPKTLELATPYEAKGDPGGTDGGTAGVATGDDPATGKLAEGPISLDSFMAKVGELTARATTRPAAFRNIDPNAEIVLKPIVLAKAGVGLRKPPVVLRRPTPAELAEARELAAQDNNPVLKR